MHWFKYFVLGFFLCFLIESCTVVKPYQRVYLNDREMQMGNDVGKQFEQHVQDIRESAYPAGSSANAGSCGCN